MKTKDLLRQKNEAKVNSIFIKLILGLISLGSILIIGAAVSEGRSYRNGVYLFLIGHILLALPYYMHRKNPFNPGTKYVFTMVTQFLVLFMIVIQAQNSPDEYLNIVWFMLISMLYFNKKLTLTLVTFNLFSYLALLFFFPALRPPSTELILDRTFQLILIGVFCYVITAFATSLFSQLGAAEEKVAVQIGELQRLGREMAVGSQSLSHSGEDLASSAEEMSAQSFQMNDTVRVLSEGSIQSSQNINKVRNSLQELSEKTEIHKDLSLKTISLTKNIAKGANEGIKDLKDMETAVKTASETFSETYQAIGEFAIFNQKIEKVLTTINDVAENINLLSINASIEAARAGEQGRGFTVVAAQIRKMASHTQTASKEIVDNIRLITSQIKKTNQQAMDTADSFQNTIQVIAKVIDTFNGIISEISQGNPLLTEVSNYLQNQYSTIDRINREVSGTAEFLQVTGGSMKDLSSVADELAKMANSISASTQELSHLAESLSNESKLFLGNDHRLLDKGTKTKV